MDQPLDLQTIIIEYNDLNTQLKALQKKVDDKKNLIKSIMKADGLTEFNAGDVIANYTTREQVNFNEDIVIDILKKQLDENELMGVVNTKEYVNFEALESLVYNNILNATYLIPAKEVKYQNVLTIRKRKGETNG